MKHLYLLFIVSMLAGCDKTNQEAKTLVDSPESIDKEEETEVGEVGRWLWKHAAETTFTISYDDSLYYILVEYNPKHYADRLEILDKRGSRYYIRNSKTAEYYSIGHDGNLEVGDNQGIFAVAKRLSNK